MAVALVRAVLGGLLTFGTVCLTVYQTMPMPRDWSDAFVAGGVAGLSYLLTRGGFEGIYDQGRDSGQPPAVNAGDVGGV